MPFKADPCIWMRENRNLKSYEYLATYVDDLCIAAQDPGKIIQTLKENYKLKVKGDGPLSHHLGADYIRDKDKTLVCQPKKYIDRLIESYHSMFKQDPPKNMRTPLEKNDHPELDDTELLTGESIQHYLTMIGQLQWLVTLGRFDIHAQVTTMSRFSSAPRKGHLERLQRVYGYVLKINHYSTRYRTKETDYSYLPNMKYDWSYTVYGNVQEIIPNNCPKPLGKSVTTTTALMPISSIVLQLVHHSLHASISATKLPLIGTPRSKPQWKLQHMDQNLWEPRQQLNRSWT